MIKQAILNDFSTIIVKGKFCKIKKEELMLFNSSKEKVKILSLEKLEDRLFLKLEEEKEPKLPYYLELNDSKIKVASHFSIIDKLFSYNGNDLGATLKENGSATLKLWSPLAKDVKVLLYDKIEQDKILYDNLQMEKKENGIWTIELNKENTKLENLDSYLYNYKIHHEGDGDYTIALDPYAKSLGVFNSEKNKIAKAAIINPSTIGPNLEFAQINNYIKREDAIIYEVHIRDFTVDPSIEKSLNTQFGTFRAFIDRLSYIKEMGFTHIQLLPVMSYYFCNEGKNKIRELNFSSTNNNYNWGYDPHSYFSLSGMYSEKPQNPKERIKEFKELISEIHKQGLGIILDVVYNHTANLFILEDLVQNYYHFSDEFAQAKSSFGGGRLGTTHYMARKLLLDSMEYWTREFKVDGFRFDMMGDHDAESIQKAYDRVKEINPNILMIGEGWRTFVGDDNDARIPADQDWVQFTDSIGVFSDEIRDELKSGYNSEGEARFLSGGKRKIGLIFDNIKAQPHNFKATKPRDVVQYIEAHDNLTLYDVLAQSIKKDPDLYNEEIHRRIRIGNAIILTSQGIAFIHAGQEYGRTKQWREKNTKPEHKETYMTNKDTRPFNFPYFIHDSYDSTDIINMFQWEKVNNTYKYPCSTLTKEYTKGLIALRKSSDAFRLGSKELVDKNVRLIYPNEKAKDLIIAYSIRGTKGDEFFIFINGDTKERMFPLDIDLSNEEIIVDENKAGIEKIIEPSGIIVNSENIIIAPLTLCIIRKSK